MYIVIALWSNTVNIHLTISVPITKNSRVLKILWTLVLRNGAHFRRASKLYKQCCVCRLLCIMTCNVADFELFFPERRQKGVAYGTQMRLKKVEATRICELVQRYWCRKSTRNKGAGCRLTLSYLCNHSAANRSNFNRTPFLTRWLP